MFSENLQNPNTFPFHLQRTDGKYGFFVPNFRRNPTGLAVCKNFLRIHKERLAKARRRMVYYIANA